MKHNVFLNVSYQFYTSSFFLLDKTTFQRSRREGINICFVPNFCFLMKIKLTNFIIDMASESFCWCVILLACHSTHLCVILHSFFVFSNLACSFV